MSNFLKRIKSFLNSLLTGILRFKELPYQFQPENPKEPLPQQSRKNKVKFGILFCLVVGAIGYLAWQSFKPHKVSFAGTVTPPQAKPLKEGTIPYPLKIHFDGSVARLEQVGKTISEEVEIKPAIKGEWRWSNDNQIVFRPRQDWAVGQEYVVKFDKDLFPNHINLKSYTYEFNSAPFTVTFQEAKFYQDPKNAKIKRIVATLKFSHPVNTRDLESKIRFKMPGQGDGFFGFGKDSVNFTVTYDKFKGEAYLQSVPIPVPPKDTSLMVLVEGGVHSLFGGPGIKQKIERSVYIPGIYNFFRIQSAKVTLVRNERYEPEQVLILEASAGAHESEILKNLSVVVLPKDKPALQGQPVLKNHYWSDPAKIGPEILKLSEPLSLDALPTDREYALLHSYKFKAEAGRFLYITLKKGTASYGDYLLAKDFIKILKVPEFPQELEIMYDGSLLSLSGEKKISMLSRGLEAVRFNIAPVLSHQINHLVSQSYGNFKSPYFRNYDFNQDNITERSTEIRELKMLAPGKTQYFSFDLSDYLTSFTDPTIRRGLFFFKVESWDPIHKTPTGKADNRLILVTDLGLIVKHAKNGGQDVFVQSIQSGRPVSAVTVQVIGKNGQPILSRLTSPDGRAQFPSLKDFTREKHPVVYVAKKGSDIAFIPYDWSDRQLNFSRFDVGGVQTQATGEGLSAVLFSDRGIYRPGEKFKIGAIVRSSDWTQSLQGIPLEIVVTDPRALMVDKKRMVLSRLGFEEYFFKTQETAPTGTYQISLYIVKDGRRGNLLGSESVRVEEFIPDRLRISTRFSKEVEVGWVHPQDLEGIITLKNLYGTPAVGHRVVSKISLSPGLPIFYKYPGYHFFDPLRAKNSFSENLPHTKTNDEGEAVLSLNLKRFEKATYFLRFEAEGFELAGGRSVASESSLIVSPLQTILGYHPDGNLTYIHKDSQRSVNIIAVNSKLEKMSVENLTASIVELRYVSILTQQRNGTYKYESIQKKIPVSKKPFKVSSSGSNFTLPTQQPGEYVLVLTDAEDTELSRILFSIVGKANLTRALDRNAELQVKLNKADFSEGEEIEVHIIAPYVGAGLLTIEKDKVYAAKWFKTETNSTVQKIRVPAGMKGNGYINVSFVRSMSSSEIFMSPLSYGVAPFFISREKLTNKIDLEFPEIARPGEPFKIKYKTQKPGKIILFAVNEGILQVAGYKTPDPLSFFFKKKALEVRTYQIMDLILPEFRLLQAFSASGGGYGAQAIGKNLNPFKRKRDPSVAFWSGILNADSTEREVTYPIPDYFDGTLRVMAVVVSADSMGAIEKKSIVRGHFILNPNVPLFAAPGDEFEVTVGVANNVEGSGEDAEVQLKLKASDHLETQDQTVRALKISKGREASATFKLKAKKKLGSARLTFTANLGDKKRKGSVDLSVRPPVPYIRDVRGGHFNSGDAKLEVKRKMYPDFRTLEVSASPVPLSLARGLIHYLKKFPYLCTEQLVSQVFPVIALKGRPEFGYSHTQSTPLVDHLLMILRARQNAEGAFGFWAANSYFSPFQTVYAAHFLTDAREKGFPVPRDLLSNALKYLRQIASSGGTSLTNLRTRAYACYILSRNGIVTSNYVSNIHSQLKKIDKKVWSEDLAAVYLAATYKLLKQDREATKLFLHTSLGVTQKPDYNNYYDTLVRDSQFLYILARHFPDLIHKVKAEEILRFVEPIGKGKFNSLSASYAILGLEAYAKTSGNLNPEEFKIQEILADRQARALKITGGLFSKADFTDQATAVRIASKVKRPIFYQMTEAGFDLALPEKETKQNIEVQREYQQDGRVLTETNLGNEIEVHLKIRAVEGSGIHDVVIVDLLPGGFEVVSESLINARKNMSRNPYDICSCHGGHVSAKASGGIVMWSPGFVDAREDRVVLSGYVDTAVREFVYRIKATNKGIYTVPPIFSESMYDPDIRALSVGAKFKVVD